MKLKVKESIDNLLGSVKLKRTGPRRKVLEVLLSARRPQTVDEIMTAMKKGGVNKVTVYRVLECFLETGLIHKAFLMERAWHFELAHNCTQSRCHPHFTCLKCGATRCLVGVSAPLVRGLGKGFILQRQQIRLEGICPSCA